MKQRPYLIWLTGGAAIAVIVVALWMAIAAMQFEPVGAEGLPGKFGGRVIALEFVSSVNDAPKVLGPTVSKNTEVMKKVLSIDFVWIGCYAALFVFVGAMLSRRNCPWAKYLALVAIITGLAAAAFDVRENLKILELLATPEVSQGQMNSVSGSERAVELQIKTNEIRDASITKWTLSFFSIALLAIAFLDLANKIAFWIAAAFVVTSVVGLLGLWNHNLLALIQFPLLIGLILLAITAFAWPNKLKEHRC